MGRMYKVSVVSGHKGEKIDLKRSDSDLKMAKKAALISSKYSHAKACDFKMAEAANLKMEKEKAFKLKASKLRKAWFLIEQKRKFFTHARGISQVSVFANHDEEYVVAATCPHENTKVLDTIHFAYNNKKEEKVNIIPTTLDEDEKVDYLKNLEEAPRVDDEARELLFKGGRLTLRRTDDDILELSIAGVDNAVKASTLLESVELEELHRLSLVGWQPSHTSAINKEAASKFDELANGLAFDFEQFKKETESAQDYHQAFLVQAEKLHKMHQQDENMLDHLVAKITPTNRGTHTLFNKKKPSFFFKNHASNPNKHGPSMHSPVGHLHHQDASNNLWHR